MGKRRIPRVSPDDVRTLHGTLPEETMDLHGLDAIAAEARVRGLVERWARGGSGGVVRIITGKGRHSEGEPILRRRVRELLDAELRHAVEEWVLESAGGSFLVRVR
jgi:DNA-nicking Smr family endonuclease